MGEFYFLFFIRIDIEESKLLLISFLEISSEFLDHLSLFIESFIFNDILVATSFEFFDKIVSLLSKLIRKRGNKGRKVTESTISEIF